MAAAVFPIIDAQHRPPAPEWPRTRMAFNLVWHHVFPYTLLRDIWNALVQNAVQSREPEAYTALRRYITICGRDLAEIDQWVDRIRQGNLTVPESDALAARAVWQPWNIVEGPAGHLRNDDYGDEYIDRFTHGITRAEYRRMLVIEGLFNEFEPLAFGENMPVELLRFIGEALLLARGRLVEVEEPIFYRPDMWVQTPEGRWHKRRNGEQFIPG